MVSAPSLRDRCLAHTGRTIHKLDSYFEVYERHFGRFVGQPVAMIEIGVGLGGSLQMWRDWLGPHARIVGLDIRPECRAFAEPGIEVRIGDQADRGFLGAVLAEFGAPAIVVDDGSHLGPDQMAAFRFLYPRLAPDGVYLVEDLHCCYLEDFDGGVRRDGTFIEACKPMLDALNGAWWQPEEDHARFGAITRSMHFYDSVAVFERGRLPQPQLSRRIPEPPPGTAIAWPRAERQP